MTERVRLRCLNCGERFDTEVLTESEKRQRDRDRRHHSPVRCPKCQRTDIRRGWD
jgi:DNA-directed RNA polymerase subunit RPC12/RpoP